MVTRAMLSILNPKALEGWNFFIPSATLLLFVPARMCHGFSMSFFAGCARFVADRRFVRPDFCLFDEEAFVI